MGSTRALKNVEVHAAAAPAAFAAPAAPTEEAVETAAALAAAAPTEPEATATAAAAAASAAPKCGDKQHEAASAAAASEATLNVTKLRDVDLFQIRIGQINTFNELCGEVFLLTIGEFHKSFPFLCKTCQHLII